LLFWQAVPAAAFNPAMVVHSDCSFVPAPTVEFVLATGESA
jgi:hypothetical protein